MTTTNDITSTAAAEINRLHNLATEHAAQAVAHAKQAGLLLLEVKAQLPHGEFLPWVRANLSVTPRQAQRYIAAAHERQSRPELKSDTMSHLELDAPRLFPGEAPTPEFLPDTGNCYISGDPEGTVYLLEPSAKFPGHFFVSRLNADDTTDYTRRPVHAAWVEFNLQFFGLEAPAAVSWRMKPSRGVQSAMETLDCVAAAA